MKMGLSLAMNSANSEITKSVRKIHNAQYPRRLALKFSQRRLLSGEREIAFVVGGASTPIVETEISGGLMPVRASTSDLPRLEVDPRIDPRVRQVRDQVHDNANEREDVERSEHHRVVAIENALETEEAQPVERENSFDQQRAREERVHESRRKSGNDDQHGIAENVSVEHLVARAALGTRCQNILLANLFQERVLSQQRHRRERRQRHRDDRQGQMPEIIENFVPPG